MTPKLRNRHRIIWIAWAIVLPILFILAIRNIPPKALQAEKISTHTQETPSPTN